MFNVNYYYDPIIENIGEFKKVNIYLTNSYKRKIVDSLIDKNYYHLMERVSKIVDGLNSKKSFIDKIKAVYKLYL